MFTLALLFAAQLADVPAEAHYTGTCIYPPALLDRAAPGELVVCNEAWVEADNVAFGQQSWSAQIRFSGTWDGDRLTVSRVTLSGGSAVRARGACQIDRVDSRVTTIACTAVAEDGSGSVASNFVRG